MSRDVFVTAAIAWTVIFLACASTSNEQTVLVPPTSIQRARAKYIAGVRALRVGDFETAARDFRDVAAGSPYLEYTRLAKLRLGDVLFQQESYAEAAEAYRDFLDSCPGDPNAHYAQYMLAKASAMAVPRNFFLLPPADRRDQSRVREALAEVNSFVERYPDSPFVRDVLKMRARLVGIRISYELEVARFYLTRERPKGALNRVTRLLRDVPVAGSDEQVYLLWARAALQQGNRAELRRACSRYLGLFPAGRLRRKMERLCADTVRSSGRSVRTGHGGAA